MVDSARCAQLYDEAAPLKDAHRGTHLMRKELQYDTSTIGGGGGRPLVHMTLSAYDRVKTSACMFTRSLMYRNHTPGMGLV